MNILQFTKEMRDKGMTFDKIGAEAFKIGLKTVNGKQYSSGPLSKMLLTKYPEYRTRVTTQAKANGFKRPNNDVQALADLIWESKEFTLSQKVRLLVSLVEG